MARRAKESNVLARDEKRSVDGQRIDPGVADTARAARRALRPLRSRECTAGIGHMPATCGREEFPSSNSCVGVSGLYFGLIVHLVQALLASGQRGKAQDGHA